MTRKAMPLILTLLAIFFVIWATMALWAILKIVLLAIGAAYVLRFGARRLDRRLGNRDASESLASGGVSLFFASPSTPAEQKLSSERSNPYSSSSKNSPPAIPGLGLPETRGDRGNEK